MPFRPHIPPTPVHERGFFAKLTGADRTRGALDEIKNALIAGDFPHVATIVAAAGPGVLEGGRTEILKLLEEVLVEVASDGRFDNDERAYVQAFVKAAALPAEEARSAYHLAMRRALREIIANSVKCDAVSNDQMEKLSAISAKFDIGDDEWKKLYVSVAEECVGDSLRTALDDGVITDEEWERAQAMSSQLRIGMSFDPETEKGIGYARSRWQALNGMLDVIAAGGVALADDEGAYFDGECDWFELRGDGRRMTYGNLTGSVRFSKGVSFRYESLSVTSPPEETMQRVDSGRLILTGERLIFMGEKANETIWWRSALEINIISPTEFEIEKSSGKSPTLAATRATLNRLFLVSSIAAGLINRKYAAVE